MGPRWAHTVGDGAHVEGEHIRSSIHARCGSLQPPCRYILISWFVCFHREGECVSLRYFRKKNPNCWGREAKIWYTHNCSHTSASCLEVRDKTLRKRHKSKQGMGKFVPSPRPRFTSISSCTDLCKRLWICKPHLLIQRCWDDGQQGQMGKSLSSQGWPSVQRAGFFWSSELENVSFLHS